MIKLLIITITAISLFARLNPFEPVATPKVDLNTTTTKQTPIQSSKPIQSVDDGLRTVKITSQDTETKSKHIVMIKEKIIEKELTNKELIEQCKVLNKNIPKPIVNVVVKPKIKPKPKNKPKRRIFTEKSYKVLPFLTIDANKRNMVIKTRKKYKLIRYYIDQDEKKFIFDFKGKVLTYTKYNNVKAPFFKSYTVGNHSENNYFRVVIVVKKGVNNYKVSMKNNIATITYIK